MARNRTAWIVGGLGAFGVGLAWLLSRRENEAAMVDLQAALAMTSAIPFRSRRWSQVVARVALETVPAGVDPLTWGKVLLGKLDRESQGGDALRPAAANGSGDRIARTLERLRREAPALESKVTISATVPSGWSAPKDSQGRVKPGPYVVPGDGLGWGRGLSQIDWMGHDFARTGPWHEPDANIAYGARYLATLYRSLAGWSGRGSVDPMRLALAAYNAGPGTVKAAVTAGRDPDSVTSGGDYSTDVYRRGALA
jgi:hypothetical protein